MHRWITWLHLTHWAHRHLTHWRWLAAFHVHLTSWEIPHVLHTMRHAHPRLLQTLHVPVRVHSMRWILLLSAVISLIISHPLHLSHLAIGWSLLLSWYSMLHRCSIDSINPRRHAVAMRARHASHIYAHWPAHILV